MGLDIYYYLLYLTLVHQRSHFDPPIERISNAALGGMWLLDNVCYAGSVSPDMAATWQSIERFM